MSLLLTGLRAEHRFNALNHARQQTNAAQKQLQKIHSYPLLSALFPATQSPGAPASAAHRRRRQGPSTAARSAHATPRAAPVCATVQAVQSRAAPSSVPATHSIRSALAARTHSSFTSHAAHRRAPFFKSAAHSETPRWKTANTARVNSRHTSARSSAPPARLSESKNSGPGYGEPDRPCRHPLQSSNQSAAPRTHHPTVDRSPHQSAVRRHSHSSRSAAAGLPAPEQAPSRRWPVGSYR